MTNEQKLAKAVLELRQAVDGMAMMTGQRRQVPEWTTPNEEIESMAADEAEQKPKRRGRQAASEKPADEHEEALGAA